MRTLWPRICLLFVLFFLCATGAKAYETIRVEAALADSSRTITGVTTVMFQFESPVDDLCFRLYSNLMCDLADGGLVVDSLFVGSRNLTEAMEVDSTDLYIPLGDEMALSGSVEVVLFFTTVVPEMVGRFGYFDEQYSLESWFPIPAPRVGDQWERIRYSEIAEPVADFFDFEVRFSYPDSLLLLAPGIVRTDTTEEGLTSLIELSESHECAVVVGSDYRLDSTMVDGTAVKLYYRDRGEPLVDTTRQVTIATLQFMSDSVLAYPYDELVVVMGGIQGGGLELPRMIWVPTRPYALLIIHEVVHQWFYGIINSNQAEYPWLDEALTEYFTVKLLARFRTYRDADFSALGMTINQSASHRYSARRGMGVMPIDRSSAEYRYRDYHKVIYSGGTLVIQTLVRLMGGENEHNFWQEYAQEYSYRRPLPEDFFRIADKYLTHAGVSAADVVSMNGVLDFAVEDITSERVELSADTSDTISDSEEKYTSDITYSIRYPLGAPVTIRLQFEDGSKQDTSLVPVSGIHVLTVENQPSRVVGAIIDPENVYALDMNLLNNSLVPGSESVGLRLLSGLTFLVELFEGVLWGW